jgi:hypothetical protein
MGWSVGDEDTDQATSQRRSRQQESALRFFFLIVTGATQE